MGWTSGAWATGAWAGTAWAAQDATVEVPDVIGETEAAGTLELETALFIVSATTAYSPSVALGLIISQDPEGGEFANEGATVTIVVSLGPEPIPDPPTNLGGDDAPPRKVKDYRPELDEKRLRERQELRELIERAAGLIDDVLEQAPETEQPAVVERQATALNVELGKLREYAEAIDGTHERALSAVQERVDSLIASAVDGLITQIADLLTDLIHEIAEDE